MNWKVVTFPALQDALSTGEAQAHLGFSGAWYSYVGGPLAASSGDLSTAHVQASVDMERTDSTPPPRRYYRYLYAKMPDGRVFQAGFFKELDYERRRDERPPWFDSYTV